MAKADLRRAAIVLASLDRDSATEICKQMSEVNAEQLLSEVARLGGVSREEQQQVLSSFRQQLGEAQRVGGPGLAEELMSAALGRTQARLHDPRQASALERLRALNKAEPNTVRRLLQGETPQMVALVLGQLTAQNAAKALQVWPEEERADLVWRVATLGQLAPGAVEAIGEALGGHSYLSDDEGTTHAGVGFVAKLLDDMDRATSKQLLEKLRARDEELAQQVEDQLFTFEDVMQLSDRDLQGVLRQIDQGVIAQALKGADDDTMQRVLLNLSTRAQEILEQEMELLGPVLVRDVEAAQKEIVKKALALEEAGELVLSKEEDDYIE